MLTDCQRTTQTDVEPHRSISFLLNQMFKQGGAGEHSLREKKQMQYKDSQQKPIPSICHVPNCGCFKASCYFES